MFASNPAGHVVPSYSKVPLLSTTLTIAPAHARNSRPKLQAEQSRLSSLAAHRFPQHHHQYCRLVLLRASTPHAHSQPPQSVTASEPGTSGQDPDGHTNVAADNLCSVHLDSSAAVAQHANSVQQPIAQPYTLPAAAGVYGTAVADATGAVQAPVATSEAIALANKETRAVNRLDIYKAIAIGGAVSVLSGVLAHEWVDAHQGLAMSTLFCLGYVGIMVEELVGLNKAGVALLMAVALWTIRSTAGLPTAQVDAEVATALASVSELIFFILGAMTIVEVVDCHGGFKRIATWVKADQRKTLAWGVGLLSFAMSAVLDNLTTTILMLSILQRSNSDDADLRKLLGAIVVIAANAGGAWTPIGDVTTTMLWVDGQITPVSTMRDLFVPSLVALAVPLALLCATAPELQGPVVRSSVVEDGVMRSLPSSSSSGSSAGSSTVPPAATQLALQQQQQQLTINGSSNSGSEASVPQHQQQQELLPFNRDLLVLSVGLSSLLFVPVFKYLTNLPPYMGMLSGLAVLWMVTDALHFGESRSFPRVQDALRNLDIAGVMFFMGILMSVEALNAAGLLGELAHTLNEAVPNVDIIAALIGLVSALIDNVPLVAATQGMYDVSSVPPDSQLWQLIALCAGTGGSLLVIGSAAGVAYMSLEGAGFTWYLKKISSWALLGYAAAIASYVAMHGLPSSSGL